VKFYNIHGHKVVPLDDEVVINNILPGESSRIKPECFYSIGLHPWYIRADSLNTSIEEMAKTSQKDEVKAIGETGLDKLTEAAFELQIEIFEKHIQISELVKKPLVIHCVKAFNELIRLKKKHKPKLPWIVHGFNSKPEVAEMLIKQNIFLSFGKAIMYPLSNAAIVLPQIPDNSFFLETDDSEFGIQEIYKAASQIKNIDIDHLKSIILQNFKNCFGN